MNRPDGVVRYGSHPDQRVELHDPAEGSQPRGVALVVHGGYWRERFTLALMRPLAADLVARGWAVANVEYRRGASGPWPAPDDDVRAAAAAVAASAWRWSWGGPLVGIGHSVGGQLVLLASGELDSAVALAPVTDAGRAWAEGLGDGAAAEFFGAGPTELPGAYAEASPIRRLPPGCPVLAVHGDADDRVPLAHSLDYVRAASGAGGSPVGLLEVPGLTHLGAIDPAAPHWEATVGWMAGAAVVR
ncbi:alpha/beta hydrolase family protein [Sinomonas flava]|uniref:Alpha/beta hydrolase n=1 Tax=Sinomonas flava TaxID=496857 RepID=A0ABN3BW20_9MICC